MFTPGLKPGDAAELLLGTLAGTMVPRILQFPTSTLDRFRIALLRQVAQMLGRNGYV